jgi:hypothetical protein
VSDLDPGWAKLRAQFPPDQLEKKPQVNCRACTDAGKAARAARDKHCDRHQVRECPNCHAYITTGHIDLDYVGHANCTNRLLEVDPTWTWEPFSLDPRGLPALDTEGNLWIRLTILGSTKPGVGDGPNMKERIGDAIRNAAMRFGVALDLWAKIPLQHELPDTNGQVSHDPVTGEVPIPDDEVRLIDRFRLIELKKLEKALGVDGDDKREKRLAWYAWRVGRVVNTSKELTLQEADVVIDELSNRLTAQQARSEA